MNRCRVALVALQGLLLAACTSIGPNTIPRDRFDYNAAISNSWKEQTLLNMVRLRYADMPMFVDVASVVSGYSFESNVSLGLEEGAIADRQRSLGSVSGTGKFVDRPTITYAPITGSDFNANFMNPIPPQMVLFLLQSGWPADIILALTVNSINGLRNRVVNAPEQQAGDPDFYRVLDIVREIQLAGAVGVQLIEDEFNNKTTLLIIYNGALGDQQQARVSELRELLGLMPDDFEISIEYGYLPARNSEVAIVTRSLLQVIYNLAAEVDVPSEHIAEGRTIPTAGDEGKHGSLIDVHNAAESPEDPFVAVKYGDSWFYIDDRDFMSKRNFTIVMLLMSLMQSGDQADLPLVTIPAS